jgi:hypothetical protein
MIRNRILVCGLALSGLALPSLAQIAPPPPPAPAPTPDYVPPPPRAVPPPPEPYKDPIADVKFESLVKRDKDGKLIRIKEPVELAALRNNPWVSKEMWNSINTVMADRQRHIDRIVVDNLDLVEKVEDGAIDQLNIGEPVTLKTVMDIITPLTPPPIIGALKDANALTPDQARLNDKIAREYTAAEFNDPSMGDSTKDPNGVSRKMIKEALQDTMDSYHRQLASAGANFDRLASKVSLTKDEESKLAKPRADLRAAKADEQRTAAMKEVFKALTPEHRQAVLKANMPEAPQAEGKKDGGKSEANTGAQKPADGGGKKMEKKGGGK